MAEKVGKKSSPYALVRDPIEANKVYSVFNARNKQTGEIWLAKVFNHNVVQQLNLEDHVEYNEEVLENLRQKENIIYVPEIFVQGDLTYLIQEKYEIKLSDYLSREVTLPPREIERILKDVFKGVCDIYEERYIHRNLRADQIVKVQGRSPNEYSWKIEALVLDNKEFRINTPFTWNRETASPEDRPEVELEQEHQDAQIVWNFGYLALEMLNGTIFVKKTGRDSQVPWGKLKEECSPDLYELIDKCYRHKLKDRVSLKRFFELRIFSDVVRPGITEYFLIASKIFKTQTMSKIQSSIHSKGMKSVRFQPSKMTKSPPPKPGEDFFHSIQEVNEQVYDESGNKDATRFCFLLEINKYLNVIPCPPDNIKMKWNRMIIDFFFLKLALKYEERARKGKHSERLDSLRQESQSKISNQSKVIRNVKEKDCQLIGKFSLNLKKDYTLEELISIFNKLNGYAYTRIQQDLEINDDPVKLKAMAYYSILAYLINVDLWTDLEVLRGSAHTEYLSLFESTSTDILVKFTQNIIKKFFEQA